MVSGRLTGVAPLRLKPLCERAFPLDGIIEKFQRQLKVRFGLTPMPGQEEYNSTGVPFGHSPSLLAVSLVGFGPVRCFVAMAAIRSDPENSAT
jgi:hypothetical protein